MSGTRIMAIVRTDADQQPSASGFITAMELCHQRKRVVRISTGSKQFDAILGG